MGKLKMMKPRLATFDARRIKPAPKQKDAIYNDPRYLKWRTQVLHRAGGRCQGPECAVPGGRTGKLYPDHITEIRDGGAEFDLANGWALCPPCHGRKTAAARAKRATESY